MSDSDIGLLFVVLVPYALVCGFLAAALAEEKNRSFGGFFVLGFFFGVLGILQAGFVPPGEAPAPTGMTRVSCPRCGAKQNVNQAQTEATCWRCPQKITLARPNGATAPADMRSVDCPRCGGRQNIGRGQRLYVCSSCKQPSNVAVHG